MRHRGYTERAVGVLAARSICGFLFPSGFFFLSAVDPTLFPGLFFFSRLLFRIFSRLRISSRYGTLQMCKNPDWSAKNQNLPLRISSVNKTTVKLMMLVSMVHVCSMRCGSPVARRQRPLRGDGVDCRALCGTTVDSCQCHVRLSQCGVCTSHRNLGMCCTPAAVHGAVDGDECHTL